VLNRLGSWAEVESVFAMGSEAVTEAERIELLCDYYYDPDEHPELDPFSGEYLAEVRRLHSKISGRNANHPSRNELAPYLEEQAVDFIGHPPPYGAGGSDMMGDFFIAWGFIMRTVDLRSGQSLLEYGPGGGQLALAFARNGCDVTVVDVEPAYIKAIEEQAELVGISIRTKVGVFGDLPEPSKRYDAVLFFEAFHHSLDHNDLLKRLHDVVGEGGLIALAGEPIIEEGGYWEPTVPLAWGPRCDLLSLWAMRTHGWMELGFREKYFREAATRAGWVVEKHECSLTFRGNTFVLRRNGQPAPTRVETRSRAGRPSDRGFGEQERL
jgi:2-polyprenyl-3-methyl-5-hydroxy-6-metoxy-1,4-benzoquinol methylase